MKPLSLVELIDKHDCDDKCRDALEKLRWPVGACCTRCGDMEVLELPNQNRWECKGCGYQFSVTSGTIMHDSHLPLRKWFLAIYLMCESRKGMSANQLKRTLGVAYRTAWYLCHRIREALGNDPLTGKALVGIIEVDERLGGRVKRGENPRSNRTLVAGAIERGGRIRLERIRDAERRTLHDFIDRAVSNKAEAVYTDELASYLGVRDGRIKHEAVNHSEEQWVVGDVHANSIEGVWSLFKRSIVGAFHKMSAKHMDRYLEELEWRFSNRKNPHVFRDTLARIVKTDPLTYRQLVDEAA